MSLRASRSEYQAAFQGELFPALEEALGPLPERSGHFVQVLEFVLVAEATIWSDALCRLDSWYRADRSWKLGEAGKTLN